MEWCYIAVSTNIKDKVVITMDSKTPCARHEEQIKTLFENDKAINKRVDEMNEIRKTLYSLDKSYSLQSQLLEQMSERNDKQDKRMDIQDERMNEYQDVMVKVSANLTELAEGQRLLNKSNKDLGGKVESLSEEIKDVKEVQETSEGKLTIHTGELLRDFILKVIIPMGIGGTVVVQVVKILKG